MEFLFCWVGDFVDLILKMDMQYPFLFRCSKYCFDGLNYSKEYKCILENCSNSMM
ncbi:hypothetical protein Fmac_012717 [Flemingia macrophylla]|uniref:Uncharacterized protein n=1 Tax=Flemingia macrophylla TaxID=520843 RepID=A0ABD1MR40_9FABA